MEMISQPLPGIFFQKILFIFRERGREGEREQEKHQCPRNTSISCLSHAPNGDQAHNAGMGPDWESNWRPFSLQAGTQSTESCQPGPVPGIIKMGNGPLNQFNHNLPEFFFKKSIEEKCSSGRLEKLGFRVTKSIFKKQCQPA